MAKLIGVYVVLHDNQVSIDFTYWLTALSNINFMNLGYTADINKIILFHSWVLYVAILEKIGIRIRGLDSE